ncbi:hypothetical protein CEP52_009015 [Fusarium oligoseptatum]|uniref:Uncharacterized protein n=1 Tax=Fusarium oligoseptatum TaxID=2604345 RepID=A0A428TEX6_9HYPO|nr:hypothetical protein CEP52_009015 [Fusarium oligoseptatum]
MVKAVVSQLTEKRDENKWQFNLLSMKVVVREHTEKLLRFVAWADTIVKAAISTQPYAALAWSAGTMLIPLAQDEMGKHEKMIEGLTVINDIQLYWKLGQETYFQASKDSTNQQLVDALVEVYLNIFKYQISAILHLAKTQFKRALAALSLDWTGQAEAIRTLSTRCNSKMLLAQHLQNEHNAQVLQKQIDASVDVLGRILESLRLDRTETRKYEEDSAKSALLQGLVPSPTDGRDRMYVSKYERDKDFNPQRLKGTCEWLLQDTLKRFQNWRDGIDSMLLLVYAGPGCGKSVLSRSLIDEGLLSTRPIASTTCYFFFKHGLSDRNNATSAMAAILHQLFSHDPSGELINIALPYHKTCGKGLSKDLDELWQIFLECVRSPEAGHVVCVLDALDECTQDREELVGKIKQFCREQQATDERRVKFFITCRPYDHILDLLESPPDDVPTTSFRVDEKSADIRRDIDRFINHQIQFSDVGKRLSSSDKDLVSKKLISMENRTYLWVKLIFDEILAKRSFYSKSSKIDKSLISGLPKSVGEAYEEILSRNQDEEETELLLRIVLAAERPLNLDEANYALTLASAEPKGFASHDELVDDCSPSDSIQSIIENICGLFISVYDSKLYFIHQTAESFLVSREPKGKWKGRFNKESAHGTLGLCCVRYLNLMRSIPTEKIGDSNRGWKPGPFVDYCAANWTSHFTSLGELSALMREESRKVWGTPDELCQWWIPVWRSHNVSAADGNFWRGTPDLTLVSYFGLLPLVHDILGEADADLKHVSYIGTPLQAAASQGHDNVVRFLLDKGADANLGGGEYLTPLIAASVGGHENVVRTLLMKKHGVNVNFTDGYWGNALERALRRANMELVDCFLRERDDCDITENTVMAAVQGQQAAQAVKALLEYRREAIKITENVISAAEDSGSEALELLLREIPHTLEINDRVAESLFRSFDANIVRLVFEQRPAEIEITDKLLAAAAGNFAGISTLEWLLDEHGEKVTVTKRVLISAAENIFHGFDVFAMLLEKRPDEIKMTASVIRAAQGNDYWGKQILELASC